MNLSKAWWFAVTAAFGCGPLTRAPAVAGDHQAPLVEGPMVVMSDSGAIDSADVRFVLPMEIHGRVVRMLVDHGSTVTLLTDSTIERLGLPHWYAPATRIDTLVKHGATALTRDSTANVTILRGDSLFEYWGEFEPHIMDSVRFAGTRQDSLLIGDEVAAITLAPFGGLVGRDLLSQFDLEFDMPAHTIRLYPRRALDPRSSAPPGMRPSDCTTATVIPHAGVDTTALDSADKAELQSKSGKRFWDEQELRLPLVVNGQRFEGMFDSGSGLTIMNWTAARALGLKPTSAGVRPITSGRLTAFSYRFDRTPAAPDTGTNHSATGLAFRIGNQALAADSVIISDPTFADFPDVKTRPLILVGLRHFRNYVLLISYSTHSVCMRKP
ncbi:MAG TPA: hypothetical protein VGP95_18460 [Gemmatimonadaceae bacterium]|nr:hypothetical protein [Gemmatimonadaceae bacterium]